MTREEIIAFASKLVTNIQSDIAWLESEGRIGKGDYTWQEHIYEDTGIDVNELDDLKNLSDDELKEIVDTYI